MYSVSVVPYLQVWPTSGATCIATLPMIAQLASSVGIGLLSSSARVTSVEYAKGVTDRHGLGGSKKNLSIKMVQFKKKIGPGGYIWLTHLL